jgi:phosphoglycolate phosphatase-like HAD superfamily hydrolase
MSATDQETRNTALSSWRDGAAKAAIVQFAEQARSLPPQERVAVFDNDGTLWCEQPRPIQLDFILRRLREMAEADATLRQRQPWKAVHEGDHAWLGGLVAQHYAGDDTNVKIFGAAVLAAYEGMSVEEFEAQADAFLRDTRHPTLERRYLECAYAPMRELLAFLEAEGFANYIASGGGRDFMRPITAEVYGIPRERVIGSSPVLSYADGTLTHTAHPSFFDDGDQKPVGIWNRTGRRPLLAGGNSNGDVPMLEFARRQEGPFLRLLVLHDDDEREFAYTAGAERALERAAAEDWTVVSMKDDWATVF